MKLEFKPEDIEPLAQELFRYFIHVSAGIEAAKMMEFPLEWENVSEHHKDDYRGHAEAAIGFCNARLKEMLEEAPKVGISKSEKWGCLASFDLSNLKEGIFSARLVAIEPLAGENIQELPSAAIEEIKDE